jgi:hypothetical protein
MRGVLIPRILFPESDDEEEEVFSKYQRARERARRQRKRERQARQQTEEQLSSDEVETLTLQCTMSPSSMFPFSCVCETHSDGRFFITRNQEDGNKNSLGNQLVAYMKEPGTGWKSQEDELKKAFVEVHDTPFELPEGEDMTELVCPILPCDVFQSALNVVRDAEFLCACSWCRRRTGVLFRPGHLLRMLNRKDSRLNKNTFASEMERWTLPSGPLEAARTC